MAAGGSVLGQCQRNVGLGYHAALGTDIPNREGDAEEAGVATQEPISCRMHCTYRRISGMSRGEYLSKVVIQVHTMCQAVFSRHSICSVNHFQIQRVIFLRALSPNHTTELVSGAKHFKQCIILGPPLTRIQTRLACTHTPLEHVLHHKHLCLLCACKCGYGLGPASAGRKWTGCGNFWTQELGT